MQKQSILFQLERFQEQCNKWDLEPYAVFLLRDKKMIFANKKGHTLLNVGYDVYQYAQDDIETVRSFELEINNVHYRGWYRYLDNYQSYMIVMSEMREDNILHLMSDSFFYSNIFDYVDTPLARINEIGEIKNANKAFQRLLGLQSGDYLSDSTCNVLLSNAICQLLSSGSKCRQFDFFESEKILSSYIVKIQNFNDLESSSDYILQVDDVTTLKRGDEELWMWAHVFEKSKRGMALLNKSWEFITINEAFAITTGFSINHLYQKHYTFLSCNTNMEYNGLWERVLKDGFWEGETLRRRLDGSTYTEWTEVQAIRNIHDEVICYHVTINDVSQKIENEAKVNYLMHYDSLTGVANRHTLLEYLHEHIHEDVALIVFDINRFKNVNDSLGHNVGDELLKNIVQRAQTYGIEKSLLARLHGDQFGIVLIDMNEQLLERYIQSLILSMNAEFFIQDHTIRLNLSIGYARNSQEMSKSAHALLKNAEIALAEAKKNNYSNIMAFNEEIQRIKNERIKLEENLRQAIQRNEFFLVFQPKIDIKTKKIMGLEALLRWRHPIDGLISPMEFIPVAEETKLIVPLGEWVLEESCRYIQKWKNEQDVPFDGRIAVNISAVQFHDPNFLEHIKHILKKHNITGEQIELEVTESVIMQDPNFATPIMHDLKKLGFTIAIDDFGTGYSNLNYLSNYPLDILKIDQSFIRGLQEKNANEAIVKAILTLGKSLNLKIVAEGVEDQWHLDFLSEQGCDIAQGFGIARPMPEDILKEWISNYVFFKTK